MKINTKQEAIDIIRGQIYAPCEDEVRAAWQFLVDKGYVWDMDAPQSPNGNWWARMASALIEAGIVKRNPA